MAWNYRVIKNILSNEELSFEVCEVYYNEEGLPISWSSEKNVLSQDSFEDLEDSLVRIKEAMDKPVLEIITVGEDTFLKELQIYIKYFILYEGGLILDHVFIIEYLDEEQNRSIDDEAYFDRELTENYLLEIGYEKKLSWRGDYFFEHNNKSDNFAEIIKLKTRGV